MLFEIGGGRGTLSKFSREPIKREQTIQRKCVEKLLVQIKTWEEEFQPQASYTLLSNNSSWGTLRCKCCDPELHWEHNY